jgi:hypothetical protein
MLSGRGTTFPVFIDPSLVWQTAYGYEQHRDEVQSACRTASHFDYSDASNSPYWSLGVGYDDSSGGDCNGAAGTAMSYYQLGVPSAIWGTHLQSASVKAQEAWSWSCSTAYVASVTLSWTGGIGAGTDWGNKPGTLSNAATAQVGPNLNSCGTAYDTNPQAWTGVGFNVLSVLSRAASEKWRTFTFRLWEQGSPSDFDWRRFGPSPYLQVTYNYTPSVPIGEKATATADGSGSAGCHTSKVSAPKMGKTASVDGPSLWASYSDRDGDKVQGNIRYWNASASTVTYKTLSPGSNLTAGEVAAQIPAAFVSGLANGTLIGWDADAYDGAYTSAWSSTCYFAVDSAAPDAPSISAAAPQSDCPSGGTVIAAGCKVKFTITANNPPADTATRFVWGLDQPPPAAGPPASQILALGQGQTSQALTITVPSPGPHNLWVYAADSAGNESAETNGTPGAITATFTAAGDTPVSFTAASTESGNFAAALAAGQNFDNTMIAGNSGPANADGSGNSLSAADLEHAGWQPGGTVTVDGATFTLPAFGAGTPDNLLSANQTIGMGGEQGGALVFLATSTDATADVPGTVTGTPDGTLAADSTVPGVIGGTAVTGQDCSGATVFDVNQPGCVPATGTVTYANGSQSSYTLTVPDWSSGPPDLAVGDFSHQVCTTVPPVCSTPVKQVYAFAVPLNPAAPVTSVSLPDVGATVSGSLSTGVTEAVPALHILGLAIRNTTTATPEVGGFLASAPSGHAWTGAFASPIEGAAAPASGRSWGDQTVRIAASADVSAPAGAAAVRIRLSDPGFQAGPASQPLQIGGATIAPQSAAGSPAPSGIPASLTFGGKAALTIPEGGDVYSDPLTLPFSVTAGQDLLVSLWIENSSRADLPENSWPSGASEWFTAVGSGNSVADNTGTPFTAGGSTRSAATAVLTGVDVTTPATAGSPGAPTVVVAGDGLIDASLSGYAVSDGGAPSIRLAGQLAPADIATGFGTVDSGIQSNQVLADGQAGGGVSLLARVDRDVLAEPDAGTVVIDEGLYDLLHTGSSSALNQNLEEAYGALVNELNAFGVNVIGSTLTPCAGYANTTANDACTAGTGNVDGNRANLNQWIAGGAQLSWPNSPADVDAAVSNGGATEALQGAYDAGDHVNLTAAGYAALAPVIVGTGAVEANLYPAPPVP